MALKHLISLESGHVQYEQTGFDVYMKDNADVDGYDHVELHATSGLDASNQKYFGAIGAKPPHWTSIQVWSDASEVIPIQAKCVVEKLGSSGEGSSHDFSKTGIYSANIARYINLAPGDILNGKFTSVAVLKSGHLAVSYRVKLTRGV